MKCVAKEYVKSNSISWPENVEHIQFSKKNSAQIWFCPRIKRETKHFLNVIYVKIWIETIFENGRKKKLNKMDDGRKKRENEIDRQEMPWRPANT